MSHSKLSEIPHLCSPNKASHPSWETNQRNTQLLLVKNVCTNELKVTLKKQMLTHGDVWINLSCLIWLDRPKPSMCLVVQLCPTPPDPMDASPPGSSVRGDSLGKNTGVGSLSLLQGIFPTRGSNSGLPHCSQILYCLSHQGSKKKKNKKQKTKNSIIINYRKSIIVLFVTDVKTHLLSPSLSICSYKTGNELWALHKKGLSIKKKSEKTMAPHSSTLAWKILWMEEPGGLQSMGSRRVQHDWATSLSIKIKRKTGFMHCI